MSTEPNAGPPPRSKPQRRWREVEERDETLQIMPAVGWYEVFADTETGRYFRQLIIGWRLARVTRAMHMLDEQGRELPAEDDPEVTTEVRSITRDGWDVVDPCGGDRGENFIGYVHESEFAEDGPLIRERAAEVIARMKASRAAPARPATP